MSGENKTIIRMCAAESETAAHRAGGGGGCLDRKEMMCVYSLALTIAVLAQVPRISSLSRLHCVGKIRAASQIEQFELFPLGIVWFYG